MENVIYSKYFALLMFLGLTVFCWLILKKDLKESRRCKNDKENKMLEVISIINSANQFENIEDKFNRYKSKLTSQILMEIMGIFIGVLAIIIILSDHFYHLFLK